jgi:O-antigen/teichoic acid export membrane protein
MERALGPAGFAAWALASALVTLFTSFVAFGLNSLTVSDFYRGRLADANGRAAVFRYALLCLVFSTLLFGALYGLAPFTVPRSTADVLLASAILMLMSPITAAYAFMQVRRKHGWVAFWPVAQNLTRFAAAVAAIVGLAYVTGALAIWLVGSLLLGIVAIVELLGSRSVMTSSRSEAAASVPEVRGTIARALRFGSAELLDSLDLKIALPLAALFMGTYDVAAVGIGMLIMSAIHYFPYVFVMRFLLPAAHRDDALGKPALSGWMTRVLWAGVIASAATGLLIVFCAPAAIALVAQGDYSAYRGMFTAVGIGTVPLTMSILVSAPLLGESHAGRLLLLRLRATLLFVLAFLGTQSIAGAAAPFIAIGVARFYLWFAVRHRLRRATVRGQDGSSEQ